MIMNGPTWTLTMHERRKRTNPRSTPPASRFAALKRTLVGCCLAAGIAAQSATFTTSAGTVVWSDKIAFQGSTCSNQAVAIPQLGLVPGGAGARAAVGPLTFSIATPSLELYLGGTTNPTPTFPADWSTLLAGHEIVISGTENLNVDLATPTTELGLDFHEPSTPCPWANACGCILCTSSTFTVTLRHAGLAIDTFTFDAPDDVAAFVGWSSMEAFDRVEFREMVGNPNHADNEFFGTFYVAAASCSAVYQRLGTGCNGSAGSPTLWSGGNLRPWLGSPFTIELQSLPSSTAAFLAFGFSATNWGLLTLPMDLQSIGMPGCTLWMSPDTTVVLGVAGGIASFVQVIPSSPGLIGVQFYNQGLILDPGVNSAGATVTNAAAARIGQ